MERKLKEELSGNRGGGTLPRRDSLRKNSEEVKKIRGGWTPKGDWGGDIFLRRDIVEKRNMLECGS